MKDPFRQENKKLRSEITKGQNDRIPNSLLTALMDIHRVAARDSIENMIISLEIIEDVVNKVVYAAAVEPVSTTATSLSENGIVPATTQFVSAFSVGGFPVEVVGPEASLRHSLVRESSAIINHVKELNTRWDPSGPRSETGGKRQKTRKQKSSKTTTTTTSDRPSTAPHADPVSERLECARKPDQYRRHRARIRRREKEAKLVGLQRKSGAVGLQGLLEELRFREGPLGKQRTSVVHIERPLMHTLKECFYSPPSATVLLGAALSFEALVTDNKSHIEVRTRCVVEAAGRAAQSVHLLSEHNQKHPKAQHSLGVGWRTMRAMVSAIGRMTDDDSGNSYKHNRKFCIEQGGLVILVRAIASDLWSSMCQHMQRRHVERNDLDESQWLPQWNQPNKKTKFITRTIMHEQTPLAAADNKEYHNRRSKHQLRPATVAVERVGLQGLLSTQPTYKKKRRRSKHQNRPLTVPYRRRRRPPAVPGSSSSSSSSSAAERSETSSRKKRRQATASKKNKPVPFSKDKESQILKKQTQLDAMRLLATWAADDSLRPLLAIGRVLEAALLIAGGRQPQLEALDSKGKGRPLTMGRPKYTGTELQIAANRLLLVFTQADFEAMESADRRRAIHSYAAKADEKLTAFLLPQSSALSLSHAPSSPPHTETAASLPSLASLSRFADAASPANPHAVARLPKLQKNNMFGRAGEPPVPISTLDMSGVPLAADGDRSKRSLGNHIATWEVFREGMMDIEVRARTRQLWRDEIEFRGILDERDRRLEGAIKHSRKMNLQYEEKKMRRNRLSRIQQLCSPEGRMEEARKIHGLNWKDPALLWGGVDAGVRRKLLGLEPAEPAKTHEYFHYQPPVVDVEPEPVVAPVTYPEYFGRCADEGGIAWWENLVVKKKRPTREELALLPYDISKDVQEEVNVLGQEAVEPLFGLEKSSFNTSADKADKMTGRSDSDIIDIVDEQLTEVVMSDLKSADHPSSLDLEASALVPLIMPVLRPSTAPDVTSQVDGKEPTRSRPMTSGAMR